MADSHLNTCNEDVEANSLSNMDPHDNWYPCDWIYTTIVYRAINCPSTTNKNTIFIHFVQSCGYDLNYNKHKKTKPWKYF